jgi:membrane protease YdiL (CAAX protease family)
VQNNSTFRRLPNSPANWPASAFPIWASILTLIGAIAIYFFSIVYLIRAFGITAQSIRAVQLTQSMVLAQVFSYVPILAYIAILLPWLAQIPLSSILGPLHGRQVFAGFVGAILMWLSVTIVGAIQAGVLGHQPTQTAVKLFENAKPGIWLDVMAVVAITLAPFVEELIFRGFIFNALWKRLPFSLSALGSGILFGIAHGQEAGIAPLAAGGFVLAAVYARSGSLWSSMISHGTFNGITLALLLIAGIKT